MISLFKIFLILMFWPFAIMYYVIKAFTNNKQPTKKIRPQNKYNPTRVSKNVVPKSIYANAYMNRKSNTTPSNYIVFDTETTGLEPEIDKIIELSAIKYINHKKVDEFSYLVNPKELVDPFITKLTGIRNADLKGQPYINEVLANFFDWIEDFTLVAHNAPYDIKMVACECYRNKIKMCNNKIIDTVTLAKRTFSKNEVENYKLETLKNYLGLSYGSHRALDDCEVCSAVYQIYCDKLNV